MEVNRNGVIRIYWVNCRYRKMYSIEVKDDLLMYNENTVVEKFVSEIINLISQKDTV